MNGGVISVLTLYIYIRTHTDRYTRTYTYCNLHISVCDSGTKLCVLCMYVCIYTGAVYMCVCVFVCVYTRRDTVASFILVYMHVYMQAQTCMYM